MSIEAARRRWKLSDLTPVADTATSTVHKASDASGAPVALKCLKPYGADEIDGARLMVWYDGNGAARILDIHDATILMEWLDGPALGDIVRAGEDEKAADILCDVAAVLHQPRGPAPSGLKTLRAHFAALFDTGPGFWPETLRPLVARAAALATELLETAPAPIPLHGDFHHDNVINSPRGWLAIDPKGIVGDPAYDVANVFRNPAGTGDLAARPDRIAALANRFHARLGLDRKRMLGWAAAHAALSGCWDHAAGNPVTWNATMLPVLLDAQERA